jgi:hypothetical protein
VNDWPTWQPDITEAHLDGDCVLVATNESFAGAPVEADAATFQSILDTSLVSWLGHLKAAAESRA